MADYKIQQIDFVSTLDATIVAVIPAASVGVPIQLMVQDV